MTDHLHALAKGRESALEAAKEREEEERERASKLWFRAADETPAVAEIRPFHATDGDDDGEPMGL